jgi:hypothetical protein
VDRHHPGADKTAASKGLGERHFLTAAAGWARTVLTTWSAAEEARIRVTNLTSTGSPSTARLPTADHAKPAA